MREVMDNSFLLSRLSTGDRAAFRDLYLRFMPDLYRFANSLCNDKALSEDIVQSVFIKLWENRDSACRIKELRAYLSHAVKNSLLNELRRERLGKTYSEEQANQLTHHETPEDQIIYKENMRLAEEALAKLSPQRKLIVELRTKHELSLDEIAKKLSISKNVVKKQLYKGLAFMRAYLRENGELTLALLGCLSTFLYFFK